MIWALVLVLAGEPVPRLSWYATAEECRAHNAVQQFHHATQGRRVEWAGCQSFRRDALRPLRVEFYAPDMTVRVEE